jgi:hypothetical protein
MRDRELTALTTLGFDELARATGGIGQIQQAVSPRVFRAVGPGAALVRPVHEAVTRGVYAGLGAGTRTLGMAAGAVAGRRQGPPISSTPLGGAAIAAITGLTGAPFEEEFGMHLGGAHHFALLNHPAVYEKLRAWLA